MTVVRTKQDKMHMKCLARCPMHRRISMNVNIDDDGNGDDDDLASLT